MLSKGEVKEGYKRDREGCTSENMHKGWIQTKFRDTVLFNVLSILIMYINVCIIKT